MFERVEFPDRSSHRLAMNELLEINPSRTVVLTVDMQRDYLDLEIARNPVSPEDAARVLNSTADLLDLARSLGVPVIHAYVARNPIEVGHGFSGSVYGGTGRTIGLSQNTQSSVPAPSRVAGTANAEVPSVLVDPADVHVTSKRVGDAYFNTELDMLMQRVFKPDTVILAGVNTESCVYSTTFATVSRGYRPVVIADCVASSRGAANHWAALELMASSVAWVLTLDELKSKLPARDHGLPSEFADSGPVAAAEGGA